ncbi:MAG: tight adherence protein B [Candidatus Aldehydirespiratoraceae bacterium]|jgi:tight adherence protein B
MTELILASVAALGVFWLYSALVMGWEGFGFGPHVSAAERNTRIDVDEWLRQAGLDDVDRREFTAVVLMLFVLGFLGAFAAFGGLVPAAALGAFAASFPIATYRHRRQARRQRAQEAWPRMIEEIRVQTASLGRSIPQALFEVGARGPEDLRPAFDAAHREWLLTTDLPRTFRVLKERLGDPTADAACETLLIAHELGGTDLDRRLEALADDRLADVQGRKDAHSRQAGARFARLFVLVVPGGMALAGMSIGNGRSAYQTGTGQVVVMIALGLVVGCWTWAGRVMRLPETQRVFKD